MIILLERIHYTPTKLCTVPRFEFGRIIILLECVFSFYTKRAIVLPKSQQQLFVTFLFEYHLYLNIRT